MNAVTPSTTGLSTLSQLRRQAQQARATGQYAIAASLEQQAAERAEMLGWPGERSRALLWQGYSLSQAGEDDLALATLLQAIQEPTTTDPADSFAALVAIIHLSLDRKPATFSQNLLAQARRSLSGVRETWTAALDWLEGELALRQGQAVIANEWQQRAWANWRDVHPRLTAATHLWALVRTAFRCGIATEVEHRATELAGLTGLTDLERQLVWRARLLAWRAQRADLTGLNEPLNEPISAELLALARRLLAETTSQVRDYGGRGEALRVLALAGRWAEIEAELPSQPLANPEFATALLAGDLALSRARLEQGWAPLDDEYMAEAEQIAVDWSSTVGGPWRETARRSYQTALELAEAEDVRLATDWHTRTLRQRLTRL